MLSYRHISDLWAGASWAEELKMKRASCAPVGPQSLNCLSCPDVGVLQPRALFCSDGLSRRNVQGWASGILARGLQLHAGRCELTGLVERRQSEMGQMETPATLQLLPQTQPWTTFISLGAVMLTGLLYWELGCFLALWGEETGFSKPCMLPRSNRVVWSLQLQLHKPGSLSGSVASFTPVAVLSADPVRQGEQVAGDGVKKGICTQMEARLFVHGNRSQRMDGNNWLRIGTGFAGTAVEDIRSVCLHVLKGNITKSSLCLSGYNCWWLVWGGLLNLTCLNSTAGAACMLQSSYRLWTSHVRICGSPGACGCATAGGGRGSRDLRSCHF